MRSEYWQHFSIGDDEGLRDFVALVNSANKKAYFANLNQHPLLLLIIELLTGQQRWVVFFQYNCNDIAHNLQRPLAALPPLVIKAYRWDSDQPRSFCCSSTA